MNSKGKKYVKQLYDFGKYFLIYLIIQTLIFSPSIFLPSLSYAVLIDETTDRLPEVLDNTYSFDSGDIDGDSDLDVVVANKGQSRVLINNGQGVFTDETETRLPVLNDTTLGVALGDVDKDNDLDLVLANAFGPNRLLINNGNGVFADETSGRLPYFNQLTMDVIFHDLDSDDDLDLVAANRGTQNRIYINNGSGVFTDESLSRLGQDSDLTYSIAVSDADGNGAPDLLFVNKDGQNRLFLNDGLGIFSEVTSTSLPQESGASTDAVFSDVEGDSDPDLFLTEGNGKVKLLINDGNGVFTDETSARLPAMEDFSIKALAGDMDFDGDEDLVVANAGQDRLLINDGAGNFSDSTNSLLPLDDRRSFGLALFDADQDFDLDLLFAAPEGQNRFLLNEIDFPRILITLSPDYIEVGHTVSIQAEVFDEDGVASTDLKIILPDSSEQAVPLAGGVGTFTTTMTGQHIAVVTAVDTHGNVGTRQALFDVQEADVTPPDVAIDITAPSPLYVGHTVTIQITATDDRSVDTLSLTINSQNIPVDSTGQAVYTPAAVGQYTVEAAATDSAGNTGSATEAFTVAQDIEAPVVNLTVTPSTVDLGNPVTAVVSASDNVTVSSLVLQLTGPGITGHIVLALDENGQATYTPYQPGSFTFEAIAVDPSDNNATAAASFEAVGVPDTTPPTVNLEVDPIAVAIGGSVTLTVTATDDTGVAGTSLSINGTVIPLDASGVATYTPPVIGDYTAVALAWDYTGNEDTETVVFRAVDPAGDVTPPVVGIDSPAADSELTEPTAIVGTVTDDTLVQYTLAYSPVGESNFINFASGTTAVTNDVLGTLDTTLLLNDLYQIRLTAVDVNGRTSSTTFVYRVTEDLKVGNFTITLQDLSIPVVGMPITINRTYDSRDKAKHDFGIGWSLDIQTVKIKKNRILGEGWYQSSSGGFIPTWCITPNGEHYVSITLPNGQTEEFDMALNPRCQQLYPVQDTTAGFTARPGTSSSLVPLGSNDLYFTGGELLDWNTFLPYNPASFQLTTAEGIVFQLDQQLGVRSITDFNGNTLTFGHNGIIHSAGKSVEFVRDSSGRITEITEPNGGVIAYEYNEKGDLTAVTDQEGLTTQYVYNTTHGLLEIKDPRGITAARNIYDESGRLIAHVDADGNRIEYSHDIEGRQEVVRDRLGNQTVFTYDDDGNVLSETDHFGNTTTYTYDSHGNELTKTDPLGNTKSRTYDDRGNILTETDPLGNTITKTYNTKNQLLSLMDAQGNTTTFTYDSNGNLLSAIEPLGKTTTSTYDTKGNRTSTTNGEGAVTRYEYDSSGNRTKFIDASGNETTYTYDNNGNKLTETKTRTDETGNSVTMTSRWVYNEKGKVIEQYDAFGNIEKTEYNAIGKEAAVIDKNGNRTEYEYDARWNLVKTIYPDGTVETASYDAEGNRISSTDRTGRTTNYEYDALKRLVRITYPDGTAVHNEYDSAGRKIASIDENGNRTTYEYDGTGKRTKSIDAYGNAMDYVYDKNGNQTSVTDANGITAAYEYDALNRKTKTIFSDGTSISVTYDKEGKKIAETDQGGNATHFEYDNLGRLTKIIDPAGGETTYTYDEVGNQLTQTDANGNTTRWTYDNLGRITSRSLPLGMKETFTYDANDNILSHTDFNGKTITYTYDVNNRMTKKTYPDGTVINYTYNPTGQVAAIEDSRGVTSYSYDLRDRLIEVTNPDGSAISYTYDAVGNVTSVTIPSGTTTYTYDALNRLATVTDTYGGVTTYEYDKVGNRSGVTYPNGTVTRYTYDELNRLIKLENLKPDSTVISSYDYVLGPVGNRLQIAESSGRTIAYTYDELYRLVQEDVADLTLGNSTTTYTYDAVGNMLTKTINGISHGYTYDANDRLLQDDNTFYTYDKNGNILEEQSPSEITTYEYDDENRLIMAATLSGSTTQYEYDADGIRISAVSNGEAISYLVDKNRDFAQVLEERNSEGALIVIYTYGDDLISQERNGNNFYYHYDGLGSTRALSDEVAVVTDTYTYDAFGSLLDSTGTTENNYLFAGEQLDPFMGTYYLRARYYDQATGRFMTMDTYMGNQYDPISLHKYLYANANPVNFVDPTGNFTMVSVSISVSIRSTLSSIALPSFNLIALTLIAKAALFVASAAVAACAISAATSAFTAAGSGNPCDVTNFNIFFTGSDTPDTRDHIRDAILSGYPAVLDRISPPKSRSWLRTDPRCVGKTGGTTGKWCDEYPFASTVQGGPGSSLRPIVAWEQRLQGGKLSAFYRACAVKAGDTIDGKFGVVPIAGPSFWVCK